MWLSPVAQVMLAVATASAADANSSVAEAAPPAIGLPEPLVTKQTLFSIPFRIERPADPSQEPREVRLFVSGDRGAHWDFYSKWDYPGKEDPAKQRFAFRAAVDGEFWFFIQTVDRAGNLKPKDAAPGLRVIVDTSLPKLQLEARPGEAGQVIVRWQIEEANLKPETLNIQYRTTPMGPWLPIAIDRQNSSGAGPVQSGEVICWPPSGAKNIQLRGEVSDAAGNPAVNHASVKPGEGAGDLPTLTAQKPEAPWRAGAAEPPPPPAQWPAERATSGPLAQATPGGQAQSPSAASRQGTANPNLSGMPNSAAAASQPAPPTSFGAGPPTAPSGPLPVGIHPPIGNQYSPLGAQSAAPTNSGPPPSERPRMVNSRLFELDYDVDSVGPAGVARVELFATRDGGRTWTSFALDNDNRSPVLVKADEEGQYGFRVVVTSGANVGGRPPQSGDLPDLVIGVDLTKPTARIIAAEQGAGAEAGKLIITWQAEDKMLLGAQPISLLLSENPSGPWTAIAAGLENTGRYAWPIDSRAPQSVYLRLEVRDEAGNVGAFDTTQSITLDRARPGVRIREVRPLGQSAQKGPQRYYFR